MISFTTYTECEILKQPRMLFEFFAQVVHCDPLLSLLHLGRRVVGGNDADDDDDDDDEDCEHNYNHKDHPDIL